MGAFDPSLADRRADETFVKTRERDAGIESWPHQGCHGKRGNLVAWAIPV